LNENNKHLHLHEKRRHKKPVRGKPVGVEAEGVPMTKNQKRKNT